jgi:hypothetical protein
MSDLHVSFPRGAVNERAHRAALDALANFERVFETGLNSLAETVETLPRVFAYTENGDNDDPMSEDVVAALIDLQLAFGRATAAIRQTLKGETAP